MPLAGKGAIIIWNDVAPEGLAAFYDWHNHEHMPERLAVPGFRRGSRYHATTSDAGPAFLTIYELADSGVATSAAYLARLNAPTDWSRSTMLHFRNMVRALTEVETSEGPGPGGVMASLRFDDSAEGATALAAVRSSAQAIADLARMPRITGAHLCVTNAVASAAKTAESRHRNDTLVAPVAVVLIEGCDVAAAAAAADALRVRCRLQTAAVHTGVYALEHAVAASQPE